jgi:hypothetical protein
MHYFSDGVRNVTKNVWMNMTYIVIDQNEYHYVVKRQIK